MQRLLIVVDYQVDFVNGTLGFPKAVAIESKIADKITHYRNNSDDVVFTFDTHTKDYLTTQEGKNLPVEHCFDGSEGWQVYGRIKDMILDTDKRFKKNTFGSDQLFDYLRKQEYDSIELVGLVSNICVISNAVLAKTAQPEAEIIIDASCTASFDDSLNEQVLNVMNGLQMKVINR